MNPNHVPLVLLVNPPVERFREPHDDAEFPSLGLAYLAGMLKRKGIPLVCLDCKYDQIDIQQFSLRYQLLESVDIVAITAMTHNILDAHNVAEIVKTIRPGTKVIVGGCHVTSEPEETLLKMKYFDLAVIGEGEYTFPELIAALRTVRDIATVDGIAFRDKNGHVVKTRLRAPIIDLDNIPFPAWDLFSRPKHKLPILTSRGCPYKCNFCARVFGSRVRYRSPQSVIAEFEYLLEQYKIKYFGIPDETFTLNRRRLRAILTLLIERKLSKKITWAAQTRVDLVTFDLFRLMKDAGCVLIGMGVESGSARVLKQSGKNITKGQAVSAVHIVRKLGIKINAYFILGHPDESPAEMLQTIRFAAMLNPDFATFGMMVPYPGTFIREMALRGEGGYKQVSEDWRDYTKSTGFPLELRNVPKRFLIIIQLTGYFYFYIRNGRWKDLGIMIDEHYRLAILNIRRLIFL